MYKARILFVISFLVSNFLFSKSIEVASQSEFERAQKVALKGDVIVWLPGTFKGVVLTLNKTGVKVKAKLPGKTIFSGASKVLITGNNITFEGFQFLNILLDKQNIIEVKGSDVFISQINIANSISWKYLVIKEQSQRVTVSYCNFENRLNLDDKNIVSILVDENKPGYHKVRYCSFKNFRGEGKDMGMEPIRIGVSTQRKFSSKSVVEYCYFTQCSGDGEIISNKSTDNVFRYNTFENNPVSELVLRHGDGAYVYGNFFLNGKGGVRVKEGSGHSIYNNYFSGLVGTSIYLQNTQLDPVKDVSVFHNTFVKSAKVRLTALGENPPKRVVFANNIFYQPIDVNVGDVTNTEVWYGNIYTGNLGISKIKGLMNVDPLMEVNKYGFYQPNYRSPAINGGSSSYRLLPKTLGAITDSDIDYDIMEKTRPKAAGKKDIGCVEFQITTHVIPRATKSTTGPKYL